MASQKTPSFLKQPVIREEDEGKRTVYFECEVSAFPKPDILWYLNKKVLRKLKKHTKVVKVLAPDHFYIALKLEEPEDDDSGLYEISVTNRGGNAIGSVNADFKPPEDHSNKGTRGKTPEPEAREEVILKKVEKKIEDIVLKKVDPSISPPKLAPTKDLDRLSRTKLDTYTPKPKDQKAPVFEKKPAIRQEEDDDRLFFECIISANPTPTISWFRDDKPVETKGRFHITCDRKGNSYSCALVIDDVDEEDGGKYKVTAKNSLGESSATINLNFDTEEEEEEEGKPTFIGKPLIKQSPDFKSIIFECNLTADPKPTLQWYLNGKPLSDGGRNKYSLLPSASGFIAKLEIAQVGNEDGGEYKVTATNSVGEGSATINLNFEGDASKKIPGGKAPRFPKKPAIKHEGEALVLEVQLEAHPFPKITWFLGSTEVREGPRHKITKKEISKDTYLLSLQILDPSPGDGGTYRCNAVNELGDSNANIVLNLQGAEEGPTFTQKPKIIPKDNGKLILMECHVKSKSALHVTWFQGTKVVQESNRFRSSVVELRANEYKVALEITDPSSKDGGVYKCNIKNAEGEINANLNLNIEGKTKLSLEVYY